MITFKEMIRAIGNYRRDMKPPNYHEVWVWLLNKEVENINELLESHKEEWANYDVPWCVMDRQIEEEEL